MQLLVSDANILIDLEEGELLDTFFKLPFEFSVPDILFYEELEEQHAHLIDMGLSVLELSAETMMYAFEITQKAHGPSRNDCFAIALAKQERCPLLSGDRDLRKLAEEELITVKGTLWIIETMIKESLLSVDNARVAYQKMRDSGRRLPWDIALRNLDRL